MDFFKNIKYKKFIIQSLIPPLITILFLYFLKIDFDKSIFNFQIFNFWLVPIFSLLLAQLILASIRFQYILKFTINKNIALKNFITLTSIGTFVGLIGLTALNDIFRTFFINRRINSINLKNAFIYTYSDRLFSILLFIPSSLLLILIYNHSLIIKLYAFFFFLIVCILLSVLFNYLIHQNRDHLIKQSKNKYYLKKSNIFNSLKLILIGITCHFCQILSIHFFTLYLSGLKEIQSVVESSFNLLDSLILSIITNLPISIGGIGVRETYLKYSNLGFTDNNVLANFASAMINYNLFFAFASIVLLGFNYGIYSLNKLRR